MTSLFAGSRLGRFLCASILPLLSIAFAHGADPVRLRESCDFNWRFVQDDVPGAEQPGYDDTQWRKLDLPHDGSIEGSFDQTAPTGGSGGYLPTGVGWYRKTFVVSEAMSTRKLSIEFDGVYENSEVWLNGQLLGRQPYGYSSFVYDLTPYVRVGQSNVLAVRVDNSRQPNSRWYSGSGIYRHVWLVATDPVHVAHWGTYVTTPSISPESATVRVRTRVSNEANREVAATITQEIIDTDGNAIAVDQSSTALAAGEQEFDQSLVIPSPRLWSTRTPNLYQLRTTVSVDGSQRDRYETTFGVRTIDYDVNHGFRLNGEPVKMRGMCLHHDGGAVGAAVPEGVLERRLRLLQAMGCNAIRCSHNPMAPEFYELCDRLGLLVMDEAFDEWTVRKPQIKYGYSDWFAEWFERDVTAMVHRDRNHPCIVMWSAGNEIGEQREPNGPAILARLVDVFHREDPTRPVTAAMDNIFTDEGPAPEAFPDLLDVVGYNYVDRWLDRRETFFGPDRSAYPQRRFIGTEDTGLHEVRGQYAFFSVPDGSPERATYASAPIRVEQLWKFALTHEYVVGHFMWTGIDYLGEARWPNKSASSGALDTCGFPKDSYYLYQSLFTDQPMLHLSPHWNWTGREGRVIPVLAYTNCDVVELTLNGRSLGAKAREFPRAGTQGGWNTYAKPRVFPSTADLHLSWDVPYEPGTLKAIGWKDGRRVCESQVHTAGVAAALEVEVDRQAIRADSRDVAHVTIKVVDQRGNLVPLADNLVKFTVDGPATLIGVDNGDPASHERFKASERHAFAGRCLAIIQTGTTAGKIRLKASADSLRGAEVTLDATEVTRPPTRITRQ